MLFSSAQFVSQKNLESQLTDCNELFLRYVGHKSLSNVEGLTDYDLPWAAYADIYHQHEIDTINGKVYSLISFACDSHGRQFLALQIKVPALNSQKQIVGVNCYVREVINSGISSLIYQQAKLDKNNELFYVGNPFEKFNLSKREEECLYFLIRGKSSKEIGRILNLSPRTVEHYIDNIKGKFGCDSKRNLIAKAIDAGYLYVIPDGVLALLNCDK